MRGCRAREDLGIGSEASEGVVDALVTVFVAKGFGKLWLAKCHDRHETDDAFKDLPIRRPGRQQSTAQDFSKGGHFKNCRYVAKMCAPLCFMISDLTSSLHETCRKVLQIAFTRASLEEGAARSCIHVCTPPASASSLQIASFAARHRNAFAAAATKSTSNSRSAT